MKGLDSSRGFSLTDFYAKRIQRLLPASLLTLLVAGVVTLAFVPQTLWGDFGAQIAASALYVENWALSIRAVDYLAQGAQPSPVQHFWSLSTEEQFYLVWPLFLMLATVFAVKLGKQRLLARVGAVAAVTTVSFAFSIYSTAIDPSAAYFITPTRAWEFGVGGLAALLVPNMRGHDAARAVAAWIGYAGIAAAALLFDAATPFPGLAAVLPVLATVAVIVAGDPQSRLSLAFITSRRPIQITGDISYSMYLWHWPVIVFVPILATGVGTVLDTLQKVLVLMATFVIGWVSKTFVEDPFRRRKSPLQRPARLSTFAGMAVGILVVASVSAYGMVTVNTRAAAAEQRIAQIEQSGLSKCFGAAAMAEVGCIADAPVTSVVPDPILASTDLMAQDCQQSATRSKIVRCVFGDDNARTSVALIGDSHANQWLPALLPIVDGRGWRLTTFFKSSCPFSTADFRNEKCDEWNDQLRGELADEHFDIVIAASTPQLSGLARSGDERLRLATDGNVEAWKPLIEDGTRVIALADTPRPDAAGVTDLPSCVLEGRECDLDVHVALRDDPSVLAVAEIGVPVVDMRDYFCNNER